MKQEQREKGFEEEQKELEEVERKAAMNGRTAKSGRERETDEMEWKETKEKKKHNGNGMEEKENEKKQKEKNTRKTQVNT